MPDSRKSKASDRESFFNRELSWLAFARRVLAMAERTRLPLLERLKFAGIVGMLHDEFCMKRMSGLKRQMVKNSTKLSLDGKTPAEEFALCRTELLAQVEALGNVVRDEIRPALLNAGLPILDYSDLKKSHARAMREYFENSVAPILTPLAVDAEHPFPFISGGKLNLAVLLPTGKKGPDRFVRIAVPENRERWVRLPDGAGFVPLEQVIASNLDLMFPDTPPRGVHLFRVTRGADGVTSQEIELADEPGSIVQLVSRDLKARRFAGVVRLQVESSMPKKLVRWLVEQLEITPDDVYPADYFLGMAELMKLKAPGRDELKLEYPDPVTHPALADLDPDDPGAIFRRIAHRDILVHHPYQDFDTSVLQFLESAAHDPAVLAIKLTIYRTSGDSPIVKALAEAARRGKQVAVLVEITARFDELPNIEWGRYLAREGVHVSYGVESLKTHVKLALVVREEGGSVRQYAHLGTGNYHSGTARVYEDLGLLTVDRQICEDVARVFNELTGATRSKKYRRLLVAPATMRTRFVELIRREAEHASAGRASGIRAKMNQLQDPDIIRELYAASRAGVPIELNVRGLCCLRPGVPGLSESIRVFGLIGRYLEHSRIYRFENDGDPEIYIGSADWMRRNLNKRMETMTPILDPRIRAQIDGMFEIYAKDNCTAWDCDANGVYVRRAPADGEPARSAQEMFIERVRQDDERAAAGDSGLSAAN